MVRRQLCLQGLALLAALAACTLRQQRTVAEACWAVSGDPDAAGAALQDCLDLLAPGGTLALPPRRFVLTQPLVLRHPVTLTTAGPARSCIGDSTACATLVLRLPGGFTQRAITVAGAGSHLHHLVVEGGKADAAHDDAASCNGPGRPSMGGIGVSARLVSITDVVVRDVACYSAVVVDAGADGFRFENNAVLSNGTHDRPAMWADGLTVIDGTDDVIRHNLFRDNTDVQLVLGGCLRCTVADNRLEETAAPGAGAFAALLLHGWPHTSGDYAGTVVSGNVIDCGPDRRCGFGLAVGGRAWYASATSGGLVANNSVARATIGINVDGLTGPVTMRDNQVALSGGRVASHCGDWAVGAVNVAPDSRAFVDATAGAAVAAADVSGRSFAGCIPGT